MKKMIAGIGTLAVGVALATSALAQTETYPMGISSPAFGPGPSGATPPAAASTAQSRSPSPSVPRSTNASRSANSSFASAPPERTEVYQTYPMGISSPAYGPGAAGSTR
jgi:hypothetical protein